MTMNSYYVLKDDLVAAGPFSDVAAAEAAARELRETQKFMLLTTRKVAKLFKRGVPLNLSVYTVVCTVKEVDK